MQCWRNKIIPNHINNPDYDNPSVIETGRSGDIDAVKVDDSNTDEAREARYTSIRNYRTLQFFKNAENKLDCRIRLVRTN